jgi:membrane protease YdiL (CAAX protease family)
MRIAACMAVFFATITLAAWGSYCISEICMKSIGPERGSYLVKTSIFFGIQFIISGAIYFAFTTISRTASEFSGRPLKLFFSKGAGTSGVMLAIVPVMVFPAATIALAWFSRNDIEINSIMRWGLLPISLAIVIARAAIEEFLFRGVLLRMLLQHSNSSALACLLLQSFIFTLFHGEAARASWLSFLGFFSVGLFLGLTYLASKRLWVSVLLHSWSNIWSGLLVGGNDTWFAGALFSERIDSFTTAKRFAIIASNLILLRLMRRCKSGGDAGGATIGNS